MVILVQSVIRGWLARRQAGTMQRKLHEEISAVKIAVKGSVADLSFNGNDELDNEVKLVERVNGLPSKRLPLKELKFSEQVSETEGTIKVQASYLAELQRRVLEAEAALREKEDDNLLLQQRLHQYESRWSEYEAKMNSMEEMWQKQMVSLQLSLVAAKKSLADEAMIKQTKQDDAISNQSNASRNRPPKPIMPHDDDEFDWDDSTSVGTKTPDYKLPSHHSDMVRELDAGMSVVRHLVKEFEHRTQVFNDDADFLVEVKSGQAEANLNPDEELRKLKQRFDNWKKDFKVSLRETKGILQKLGSVDSLAEKSKKKWWGKRSS
jgi:myosin-5